VQYKPVGGLTPLLYAARAACFACVKTMVEAGADTDRPNPDGMTPMMMALDNGAPEIAQYLLDRGANPHTWDWWGRTPLYVAVRMRNGADGRIGRRMPASLAFIKALLTAGANSNPQLASKEPSRGGREGRFQEDLLATGATPLLRAAQTFDNEVITLLLAHGALVDLPNASGVTPFMAAAGIGTRGAASVAGPGPADNATVLALETMEILRKAGADVNARITDVTSLTARIARDNSMTGRQGQTALFVSSERGRTEMVRYLVGHGARTDLKDDAGKTALDLVPGRGLGDGRVESARTTELVTLLRETGGAQK